MEGLEIDCILTILTCPSHEPFLAQAMVKMQSDYYLVLIYDYLRTEAASNELFTS